MVETAPSERECHQGCLQVRRGVVSAPLHTLYLAQATSGAGVCPVCALAPFLSSKARSVLPFVWLTGTRPSPAPGSPMPPKSKLGVRPQALPPSRTRHPHPAPDPSGPWGPGGPVAREEAACGFLFGSCPPCAPVRGEGLRQELALGVRRAPAPGTKSTASDASSHATAAQPSERKPSELWDKSGSHWGGGLPGLWTLGPRLGAVLPLPCPFPHPLPPPAPPPCPPPQSARGDSPAPLPCAPACPRLAIPVPHCLRKSPSPLLLDWRPPRGRREGSPLLSHLFLLSPFVPPWPPPSHSTPRSPTRGYSPPS